MIAAEAQPKGHRGSQSAAEVGRSSSDRNVIFFHSSNDAQVRHCAGAGAPPPGGLYKVHSLTAVKAGREAWCATLNTSPGLSPVDRYRRAWLWFLKRWYGERKKQQTLFARRASFGREGRDSVHLCRCRPPPTPVWLQSSAQANHVGQHGSSGQFVLSCATQLFSLAFKGSSGERCFLCAAALLSGICFKKSTKHK